MTSVDVLTRAASLIQRDGLHKGDYWPGRDTGVPYSPGLPCCTVGALAVAVGITHIPVSPLFSNRDWFSEIEAPLGELARYINAGRPPGRISFIDAWNDAKGQTASNVAATMRLCAAELRKQAA